MLFLVQVTYMLRYTLDSAKSKVATTPNLDSSAISLATLALPRTLSSENISDLTMLHSALHWHLQEDELIDEETNHIESASLVCKVKHFIIHFDT